MVTGPFREVDANPEIRAIIWTATGRGFCTGDDVKELLGAGAEELARRLRTGELELPGPVMARSDTPIRMSRAGEGKELRSFLGR